MRRTLCLFLGLALLLATRASAQDLVPSAQGDFDDYVLALSWQPGFCQSVHDGRKAQFMFEHVEPLECANQPELEDRAEYLTVHGLWPSLPHSLEYRVSESEWRNVGCAAVGVEYPYVNSGIKCAAPPLDLGEDTLGLLAADMPGANGQSCLERYEYAKHGICFGFDPDVYFRTAVRLNREIKASFMGRVLRERYGEEISRPVLMYALGGLLGHQTLRRVRLICQESEDGAYLKEIQIPLRRDAINRPLGPDSLGKALEPGNCGVFILDARGY